MVFAVGDLFEIASSDDAIGLGLGYAGLIALALEVIVLLNQQPVGLAFIGSFAAHANQSPFAL
jgi:hypothetical protein